MAEVQLEARVLINGFDLSPYLQSIEQNAAVNMLDKSNFASPNGAKEWQAGLSERTFTAEGFFAYDQNDDGFSVDKLFSDAFNASAERLLSYGTQGEINIGDIATMANIKQASYNVSSTYGNLIMSNFEAKATGTADLRGYARGVWLMSQIVTGSANGSTYDNTAPSTGYFAHVHVTNADGDANVLIQHSTNGSVWTDLDDLSGLISGIGAVQVSSTNASVNRYVRAIVGGITGTTAKVSVAIKLGYTG